jgi:hypothetical protein
VTGPDVLEWVGLSLAGGWGWVIAGVCIGVVLAVVTRVR